MFLILTPILYILLIYVIAAVLPAVILLRYVDNQPNLHRQPLGLRNRLILDGVYAALLAGLLEYIAEYFFHRSGGHSLTVLAYLIVGVIEEGTKFLFMKKDTWNSPFFETRFDGIQYAVFVSLGFAAFENIKYVFSYGLSVAPARAMLAIPGHTAFAVLMGYFYGRAKYQHDVGDSSMAFVTALIGYIAAVLLHGTYDFCAMSSTGIPTFVFFLVVILIYVIIFRLVHHEAEHNRIV